MVLGFWGGECPLGEKKSNSGVSCRRHGSGEWVGSGLVPESRAVWLHIVQSCSAHAVLGRSCIPLQRTAAGFRPGYPDVCVVTCFGLPMCRAGVWIRTPAPGVGGFRLVSSGLRATLKELHSQKVVLYRVAIFRIKTVGGGGPRARWAFGAKQQGCFEECTPWH